MRSVPPLLALLVVGCGTAAPVRGPNAVRVAAAASLKPALEEVIAAFRGRHPDVSVTATYGASGTFFAQITGGAPFDVFLSADADYPRRLVDQGAAPPDGFFRYATGRLVVWVPADSALPLDADGLKALGGPAVRKLAIANPRHAPYGRAAEAALTRAGVWEAVRDRLVMGESVEQTANALTTGAADAGLLPQSLARAPALAAGRVWAVPADLYPPIEQAGVVLAGAADPAAAARLRAFLTAPDGRAILERHGFDPPRE
jgi:molybdate transport system substrate-binding protein